MWKQIFKVTLIAGVMDITAAFIHAYFSSHITPDIVLRYIASGLFGKSAFVGGYEFLLVGVLVHFLIVFFLCIILFLSLPDN